MNKKPRNISHEAGFSLIELIIAMTVSLVLMSIISTMLSETLRTRARQLQRVSALSDAQRAINMISREIGNGGLGIDGNGLVPVDSNSSAIRVRANLDALVGVAGGGNLNQVGEDVMYLLDGTRLLRHDVNEAAGAQTSVLARPINALRFYYYDERVTYDTSNTGNCDYTATTPITNVRNAAGATEAEVTSTSDAKFVVLALCVELPAVGTLGTNGYQPLSREQIVSDVAIRNALLDTY